MDWILEMIENKINVQEIINEIKSKTNSSEAPQMWEILKSRGIGAKMNSLEIIEILSFL